MITKFTRHAGVSALRHDHYQVLTPDVRKACEFYTAAGFRLSEYIAPAGTFDLPELEVAVAEDQSVEPHRLQQLQLRHTTVLVAEQIALHEIAHAKLHHLEPMTAGQYQLTAAQDARKVNAEPAEKAADNQADVLADRWIETAHEAVKHLIRWYTTAQQRAVMNCTALQTLHKLGEL